MELLLWYIVGLVVILSCSSQKETFFGSEKRRQRFNDKPVNILILLADDLGYGDTSVAPFIGSGISTPELEAMAARGTIMTNFHTAAPVCTPTRASILTGMFPWRLGIKAVYEYGEKGKSNRDDWLAQVPTLAMAFKEADYFTGHSGKWHVGGMRNDDYDMRMLPEKPLENELPVRGSRRCPHPGPNQQGFQKYVSVLDGPGAPRQNDLQIHSCLYSQGCTHLLENDHPMGEKGVTTSGRYLFDCEVDHALRMINESLALSKPFFIQVWFHAPHGPWEFIPEYEHQYRSSRAEAKSTCLLSRDRRFCNDVFGAFGSKFDKYRTMVTGMDRSVGTLLRAVKSLGIERETLIVFLSDNGPEDDAGTTSNSPRNCTAGLRSNKRFLYEGGLRVPSIWQWVGTIPKGKESKVMAISTDIYPTVLDAASIPVPSVARIDGISLLPELISLHRTQKKVKRIYTERMGLWHTDYESPRATTGVLFEFKIVLNQTDHPLEIFDLKNDMGENNNLLPSLFKTSLNDILAWKNSPKCQLIRPQALLLDTHNRSDPWLHRFLISKTYSIISGFAKHGNLAHQKYLSLNPGRIYVPSLTSDTRVPQRMSAYRKWNENAATEHRKKLIYSSTCSSPCSCRVPNASEISSLPFEEVHVNEAALIPQKFINATKVLFENLSY